MNSNFEKHEKHLLYLDEEREYQRENRSKEPYFYQEAWIAPIYSSTTANHDYL